MGELADQKFKRRCFPRREASVCGEPEDSEREKSGTGRGSSSQVATVAGNCSESPVCGGVFEEFAALEKGIAEIFA